MTQFYCSNYRTYLSHCFSVTIVKLHNLDNSIREFTINVLKACTPFFSDLDWHISFIVTEDWEVGQVILWSLVTTWRMNATLPCSQICLTIVSFKNALNFFSRRLAPRSVWGLCEREPATKVTSISGQCERDIMETLMWDPWGKEIRATLIWGQWERENKVTLTWDPWGRRGTK